MNESTEMGRIKATDQPAFCFDFVFLPARWDVDPACFAKFMHTGEAD